MMVIGEFTQQANLRQDGYLLGQAMDQVIKTLMIVRAIVFGKGKKNSVDPWLGKSKKSHVRTVGHSFAYQP